MSSSGYRGRSFGPRGARTNGPPIGFNGPRFPHPTFNHPRPSHRLSGPKFVPWQQNKNFHPQYRGNMQYHPNNRGRATGGRGIVRFSVSGRPPLSQFRFIRNPAPSTAPMLPPEKQVEDKSVLTPQTPLLGSEEERQQKIAETADKLKKKLSSITQEELSNLWKDDLSVLPNNKEENIRNRGIPELRHEPPELNLTFTDFRDIGRIDCNNLKCGNLDSKLSDEISITFDKKHKDNVASTNSEVIIVDESREEPLIILDSCDKDDLNQSNVSVEDECQEQIHELSNLECNVEHLQVQSNDITGNLPSSNVDVDEKSSTLNADEENIINLSPTESVDNSLLKKVLDVNDVKTASTSVLTTNNQNESKVNFSQNQNTVQADIQNQNSNITQDSNITDANIQHNDDHTEIKLLEDDQNQNDLETSVPQEVIHQNLKNIPEEIHLNIVCDPASSTYLNYNEVNNKLNDRKLNNPLAFQSKVFNVSPRFTSRTGGPRFHWTFQQNVTNSFFRGQRLSFHPGNRISPPKRVTSFKPTDLVSVGFDPRTLPPFIHNVPVSSHDTQHNSIVPFSSNDLPPAFDPSEPPPNIKSKSGTESLNKQESLQPLANVSQNISKVIEPSSAFDARRPPSIRIPYVSVTIGEQIPEFNPQQPPPKIHKRERTSFQPPPIFHPTLSSQEHSSLTVPFDASRSNAVPLNLMETSSVQDFNIGPAMPDFPRLNSSINIPSHRPFTSNVQMNFPSVVSRTSSGQEMMGFSLRLPPMTITEVPPPPPKEPSSSVKGNSNPNQAINMDDGLEDMQEAMEFAKQIMNLTEEEVKNRDTPVSESALSPAEIPVPAADIADTSASTEKGNASNTKKKKKKEGKSRKSRQKVVACGPELSRLEKQEDVEMTDKGQSVENSKSTQSKSTEDALLSNDQIRPKVVFNLNSKTKRIQKPEEWHRIPLNVSENRETSQQSLNKERSNFRKHHPFESRNQQKEAKVKRNIDSTQVASISTQEKSNNAQSHCHKSHRDSERLQENATTLPGNLVSARKSQKPRDESRKEKALVSEALWKSRVISRFLKMSKNDICNMVNNSSLRKFDIAMKHLVKERKSSLSLELRNVEDEKMKEYDRIEFMNQLNAMLDPSAVVGITDLPTEFIHHLSEVLQLDIPFDAPELPQNSDTNGTKVTNQRENSREHVTSSDTQEPNLQQDKLLPRGKEEPDHRHHRHRHHHHHHHAESSIVKDEAILSESTHKQQPLFNEADLDDILSQVAERTRTLSSSSLPAEPIAERIVVETPRTVSDVSSTRGTVDSKAPTERVANRTVADLDDIFSAGIARARQLGKDNASVDHHSRARKSSSADRNSSLRRERWNRKAREDPDTFRNLTKEEWEAKYGPAVLPPRRNASSSVENLSNRRAAAHRRYCSSDSPARRSSVSPLDNPGLVPTRSNNVTERCCVAEVSKETEEAEKSESSSESSSSSFSESDSDGEETVAPDVTKLLKVIKEKEKIAKKRSLNETIRDEVAAEIEKEWKEKSKHKERRKRDRREKQRRERRRKRRRDSHSGSRSDSGQEFRLLTKDEIKKEAKESKPSTPEENSSLPGGVASNNASIDKPLLTDSRNESQGLRAEKEQRVSTFVCKQAEQARNKSSTVVSPTTKTKAQLKQMPESNEKQITEEVVEVAKNVERTRNPVEVTRDHETGRNSGEQQIDIPSKDVASRQACQTASNLSVKESSSSLQPCNEIAISNNNTTRAVIHITNNNSISNTVFNTNASNVKHDRGTTPSTKENKGGNGYRKIDIKAYKERALQRRLKELDASRERPMVSFAQGSSSQSFAKSKSNVESGSSEVNETKTNETSKVQTSKDLRLIKVRPTASTAQESDKGAKEKSRSSREERQSTQKMKELSAPTRSTDTDSNVVADPAKSKLKERDDDNSKRLISPAVDSKFKNIRSEGRKELKLIKERTKSSNKKKRKCSTFSSKLDSTEVRKSLCKTASRSGEKLPLIASSRKVTSQSDVEKVSDHDSSKLQALIERRTPQKRIDHVAFVANNEQNVIDRVTASTRVNNEVIQVANRQVVNQKEKEKGEEDDDGGSSTSLEKKKERNVTEILEKKRGASITSINEYKASMSVESTSIESSNKQRDVCNDASSTSLVHDESIPAEKCMKSAAPPVFDRVARESHHLLSERIDVDIEKHGHRINVRNFKNDEVSGGASSVLETKNVDGTSVVEKTADTSETVAREQDGSGKNSRLDESDEVRNNKTTSPSSPSSPFKGFLVDTVDNDSIYQVSRLCRARVEDEAVRESSTKEQGDPLSSRKRLQINQLFDDKSIVKSTGEDRNDGDEKVKTGKSSDLEKTVDDKDSNVKGEVDETEEDDRGYDFSSVQKKFLTGIENHDTFNEDSEPFIVLDEYIDDTDGRSIEKFNCPPELDLEGADIFTSERNFEFSRGDSGEQGEQDATTPGCENEIPTLPREDDASPLQLFADKNTVNTTNVFSSISASTVGSNSEDAVASTVLERPAEYLQNVADAAKDICQNGDDTIERQKSIREGKEEDDCTDDSQKLDTGNANRNEDPRGEPQSFAAPKTPAKEANAAELPGELRKQRDLATSTPSKVKTLVDKNVKESVNSSKSGKDKSRVLNNVRNKPRMKQKREKRISEKLLARLKQPTTKEAVMARMIEIDVEIHKLMTEKMTLYQMLTSDALPSDKNLQQSNAEDKKKRIESPVIRPRTPSALMSQLLQNIDAAPATNHHCERESFPVKDSSFTPNKSKTLGKHNHHAESCKESCVSVCDSEGEEIDGKSSRKRKRQKVERSVKRFESELDIDGKRQANDNAMKVTSKRDNARRPATVQSSLFSDRSILTSETTKLQEDVGKDPSRSRVENGKAEEIVRYRSKVAQFDGGDDVESGRSSVEKNEASSRESKTPERLSIYSDDSTWDCFLQNSDDQKKPNTGLALLEETYRKEMARARRMRENTRKRKRKLGNLLRTVNALTSDEEELPLATLYAKKLHQKRELLDSFEQRMKQASDCTSVAETSDPQLWRNVVEVINAVAENRTGDLYAEEPKKMLTEATVLNSRENVEFKNDEEKQMAGCCTLKGVEESSTELVEFSENKNERNDSKTDDTQTILSDKSQENSEHSQRDLEISVSSKIAKDLPETSTNDKVNFVESSVQQTVASDIVEIKRTTTLIEDSDSCRITESNSNNIADDRNISNVSEPLEKIDVETKKSNSKDKRVDIDENIVAQDSVDKQFVLIDSDKNVNIADEITSKNKPELDDSELENSNESNVQDPYSKDNTDSHSSGESNGVPQDKHFVNLKEHKEPRKRKDTERFDKTGEENNNQSYSFIESVEVLKGDEAFLGRKLLKRKRGSKTRVRRSSRYTEEPAKHVKVEVDTAVPIAKQDEKNFKTQFLSVLSVSSSSSSYEELESMLVNPKKCRSVQKLSHKLSSESDLKAFKRHEKRTMFEMMNCVVRLIDCRQTILKPNVSSNVLQKYRITRVNTHCINSPQTEALSASSTQSTLTKDSPKQTPCEFSQSQKKIDATDQTSSAVKKATKSAKVNSPVNDAKECENPDTEVIPVLVNELVTMDIAQNCEITDVEIVEDRARVTMNEEHSNSESPMTVIDAKEDKEQARTQYTVHKGPILDIKVNRVLKKKLKKK